MINVINRNIMQYLKLVFENSFNHLDNHEKLMFRKLETYSRKLITLELHLQFNIICLKENLLPIYTNYNTKYKS